MLLNLLASRPTHYLFLPCGITTSCKPQLVLSTLFVGCLCCWCCAWRPANDLVRQKVKTSIRSPTLSLGPFWLAHLWPSLGKAGLTKIALLHFSIATYFHRVGNGLKSISIAFWNVSNVFQPIWNALQNHFKTLSMHFQTLTTHSMKRPAVWNHLQNHCYQLLKSLQRNVSPLAWTLACTVSLIYQF